MFRPQTTQQNQPTTKSTSRHRIGNLLIILGLATSAGAALALVPAMLPALADSLSATAPHAYWYVSRASAFIAFGLLWLSMMAGLGITSKLARFWPGMPASYELHRFTALLGIAFGTLHALVLLGDQYMNYTLTQLLVPFTGSNLQARMGGLRAIRLLPVVGGFLQLLHADKLGVYAWRSIHMLSFALFLMTLVHGLNSGTDSATLPAQALYWTSAASVLICSIYRIFVVRIGRHKSAPSARRLVALGGKSQAGSMVPVRVDESN